MSHFLAFKKKKKKIKTNIINNVKNTGYLFAFSYANAGPIPFGKKTVYLRVSESNNRRNETRHFLTP